MGEYEYGAAPARFTWLTGTGGLKGIQGGGTFAPVFDAKPAQEGTGQGCRRGSEKRDPTGDERGPGGVAVGIHLAVPLHAVDHDIHALQPHALQAFRKAG
mgnify:CR=1 FL=1